MARCLICRTGSSFTRWVVENESFKRFVGDMVYAITNPG